MLTDLQLMQQVLFGRSEFFEELVRRHESALLRAALSKLRFQQLAEEAVQETFLAAFARRQTFNPAYSFRGWLWTILLNECRTTARRELGRADRGAGSLGQSDDWTTQQCPSFRAEQVTPLAELLSAERHELLSRLLADLPELEADALRMRFFGDLQFQEIAEASGCSLNGAKMRVKRGLERLAAALTRSGSPLAEGEQT